MWAKIIAIFTGQTVEAVLEYKRVKAEAKAKIVLERLRGKAAYEKAKSERAASSEGYDHAWETHSINNSGWKDEGTWLVMSIPMVLSFIPFFQPFVVDGFEALEGTPLWYRTILVTIYLATYGIRIYRRNAETKQNLLGMIK